MPHIRIDITGLNLSTTAIGVINAIDDVDNYNFVAKGLAKLPIPLQNRFAKRYVDMTDVKKRSAKKSFKANEWFRRSIEKLKPRFAVLFSITQNMPLPWHILSNKDKTKKHAGVLAMQAMQIMIDIADEQPEDDRDLHTLFEKVGEFALQFGVVPEHWKNRHLVTDLHLESSLLRLQKEKWWATKLKKVRIRYLELLEIATGQVGRDLFRNKKTGKAFRKGINPYCSKLAISEFNQQQASGRAYLEMLELVNDQGDVIDLMKAVEAGLSNPVNRRNELMLRLRETEELATEMGYVGVFYTMTCPSKYHANSASWDGTTPKEAQSYLTKTWSQARSKLNRLGIPYFGMRVAEPHQDGCPHWHMVLFMPKSNLHEVNHLLRRYFCKEDRAELVNRFKERRNYKAAYIDLRRIWGLKKKHGLKKNKNFHAKEPHKSYFPSSPRFTPVVIDPNLGGAASYLAKYISKNIDGFSLKADLDEETGEYLQKAVNPVLAWASTWGIRQFQFQGSPSVTIYRELRRQRKAIEHEELEQVRKAADEGSWINFVKLMGGMCIGRNSRFKLFHEVTPFGNDYGEAVKRVKGVIDEVTDNCLLTRLTSWTKQIKGTAEKLRSEGQSFVSAAHQSWTCGNNCTVGAIGPAEELKLIKLGFNKDQIDDLKQGKKIIFEDVIVKVVNGELTILEGQTLIDEEKRLDIEWTAQMNALKAIPSRVMTFDHTERDKIDKFALNNKWRRSGFSIYMMNSDDWAQAKELVELSYSYANIDGREKISPTIKEHKDFYHADIIGDRDLAMLVLSGEASLMDQIEQDFWLAA